MAWIPTEDEIKFYKSLNKDKQANDEYYRAMLPVLLEYVNEEYRQNFKPDSLPGSVKLFLAKAIEFYSNKAGLESRRMGTVSYSFKLSELPKSITDLLIKYRKARAYRVR